MPPSTPPQVAAATLLAYFASMPVPLLPEELAGQVDGCQEPPTYASAEATLRVLLPPESHATLWLTVDLLRSLTTREASAASGQSVAQLAPLFADTLFGRAVGGEERVAAGRRAQFVGVLIAGHSPGGVLQS